MESRRARSYGRWLARAMHACSPYPTTRGHNEVPWPDAGHLHFIDNPLTNKQNSEGVACLRIALEAIDGDLLHVHGAGRLAGDGVSAGERGILNFRVWTRFPVLL